ncbi:uncharacterized protein LOC103506240 [Diaphorina citri]|uniref:Uncharacterized protein LOC103506240 n=1 Tax=Diaphorina citri TaxID=121845 RepID=A0A1S3CX61_DIACI|nr:uncharacterized protein LOC103506240 [Diaphorina citri]KAI5734730.1 hypothetical protein M8J77_009885 [Diaphorina citri]
MDPTSSNVSVKLGRVHELTTYGTKAVILFDHEGQVQRATLRSRNLIHDGILLPEDTSLEKYLPVDTEVYFKAHPFPDFNNEISQFYTLVCWKREDIDFPKHPLVRVFHGMCTQPCYFSHHAEGYGVAYCKEDPSELIKFLYHKVYIKGEKYREGLIGFKTTVEMQCDAVPTPVNPVDGTGWFALVLWRGKRPKTNEMKEFHLQSNMNENIKQLTQNCRSIFMRSTGQIIKLLDKEYGVALAMIRTNEWHTVLFHASACYLNETSLAQVNLRAVFQPGDKVNLVAAKAPSQLSYQWVASHVSIFKDPSVSII